MTTVRRLAAVLIALALLLAPRFFARAEDDSPDVETAVEAGASVSLSISKYAGTPRFEELTAALPEMRKKAFATIQNRIGIAYTDRGTIDVRFLDVNEEGLRQYGADMAMRRTEKTATGEKMVVILFWEYIMNGLADPQTELVHELFHAIHREGTTEEAYAKLPKWIREGLAVWVAGQGPDRIRWILQDLVEAGPDGLVNGLDNQPHTMNDYAEDYLAFEYVREKHGLPKLFALAKDLVKNQEDYRALFLKHTGEPWAQFEKNARAFALDRVRKEEGGVREKFLPGLQLYEKGLFAPASEVLSIFLKENPENYLTGLARYYLARCLFQQGKFSDARHALKDVIERYRGKIGLIDDAKMYVGLSYSKEKDWANARRELEEMIRDYPYPVTILPVARYYLGAALINLGRHAEAIPVFEAGLKLYPKSKAADDLLWGLSQATMRAGKHDVAREALRKLVSLFPKSTHATPAQKQLQQMEATDSVASRPGIEGVRALAGRKDWAAVVALAQETLKRGPPDEEAAETQYLLGTGYQSLDLHDEAIAACQTLVDRWPSSAFADDGRFRLAKSYYLQGKYEPATEHFQRLQADHPRHDYQASANLYCGESFVHLRKYTRALERLQACAATRDKKYVFHACFWMGMAYRALDEPANAEKAFRRAIAEAPDPNHAVVARARAELEK